MKIKNLFNCSVIVTPEDSQFATLASGIDADLMHLIYQNKANKYVTVIMFKNHSVISKENISVMGAPSFSDPRKQILKDIKLWVREQI